jgi:hypothetical protein
MNAYQARNAFHPPFKHGVRVIVAKNKRLPAFLQLGLTREQIEKSPTLKRLWDQFQSTVAPDVLKIYEGPIPELLKPGQLPEDHPLVKFLMEAQKAQEQENEPEVDKAQDRGNEPKIEPKIEPEIERAWVDQPLRRRPKIEFKHLPQVLEALRLEQAKD